MIALNNFVVLILFQVALKVNQANSQYLKELTEVQQELIPTGISSLYVEPAKETTEVKADPLGLLNRLIQLANIIVSNEKQLKDVLNSRIVNIDNTPKVKTIPNQVLLQNRVNVPVNFASNNQMLTLGAKPKGLADIEMKNNRIQLNQAEISFKQNQRNILLNENVIGKQQISRKIQENKEQRSIIPESIYQKFEGIPKPNTPFHTSYSQVQKLEPNRLLSVDKIENSNVRNIQTNRVDKIPQKLVANRIPQVNVPVQYKNKAKVIPKVRNNIIEPYQYETQNNNLPPNLPTVTIPEVIKSYMQRNQKQPIIITSSPDINPYVTPFQNQPQFATVNIPTLNVIPKPETIPKQFTLQNKNPNVKNENISGFNKGIQSSTPSLNPNNERLSVNSKVKNQENQKVLPKSRILEGTSVSKSLGNNQKVVSRTLLPKISSSIILPGYNPFVLPSLALCPTVSRKGSCEKQRNILVPPPFL